MSTSGRRAITIPLYLALFALSLALLPIALPLAAVWDLARSTRLGATRSLVFFVWYLGCETWGLASCLGLWLGRLALRPGPERWLAWHQALKEAWARALLMGAARIYGMRFEVVGDELAAAGPQLLFVRHVSVADTLLAAVFAERRHRIRYRYVIKRELLWDPCLDVAGNRLGACFVDRNSDDSAREIARVRTLAADLGLRDAVLLYPEGTRFTPEKREQVLRRLAERGERDLLERARSLHNVLPPRLGGALALLEAAPEADVVFLAHAGFEGITRFSELLSGGLVRRTLRVAFWRVPASEVPREPDARIDWLFDQWRRLDAWVGDHLKEGA